MRQLENGENSTSMNDIEIYSDLIEEIDETVLIRVHHHEINYKEMIQRAISDDNSAICGVAHCLFWGKGGKRSREYAKFILRKLVIEKASLPAEYLLAHYTIIDGDKEKGFLQLRNLAEEGFLPAKTLFYYLGYKNKYKNISLSQVRKKLSESAEEGHLQAWFLLMGLTKYCPILTRVRMYIYYLFRFLGSKFLKVTKDLEKSEKAFLYD